VYDWEDFLTVADALLANVGGVGAERTAISRAY
jgi:hydroxyethylthiazole kinase-like sugar kinase family protein